MQPLKHIDCETTGRDWSKQTKVICMVWDSLSARLSQYSPYWDSQWFRAGVGWDKLPQCIPERSRFPDVFDDPVGYLCVSNSVSPKLALGSAVSSPTIRWARSPVGARADKLTYSQTIHSYLPSHVPIPARGWSAFSIAAHGVRYDTRRRISAD
jgi:hypothetical protein